MEFEVANMDSGKVWSFEDPIKLVWTDPPFGTGKVMDQGGNSYKDLTPSDAINLTLDAMANMRQYLTNDAVICICADYRIIHHLIVCLDWLYFQGEIIWTFGLGRPRTNWWPVRHNTIATFTMSKELPPFNKDAVPRENRKAPKPGYEGDKPAGSVWDKTMSNSDRERVGYPNQKPLDIITPFVLAHTNKGDFVADPFCGSGSTGHAALANRRSFIGQDLNPEAIETTNSRLYGFFPNSTEV